MGDLLTADNARYTELWSRLTTHQRRVIAALVASGGTSSIYSEAYRRQYALGAASSVQRSIKALQEQGLVDGPSPGEYRVPENFLRAWITRLTTNAPLAIQISDTISVTDSVTVKIEPPKKPKK